MSEYILIPEWDGSRVVLGATVRAKNPMRTRYFDVLPSQVAISPTPGTGHLAGSFPDGITSIEGQPTSATVRVLYRPESGHPGDGAVVAQVQSAPDGTWRVDGLNPALKYDVVGRKSGHNDVIMANVQPVV